MSWTLKVDLDGDVRRLPNWWQEAASVPTYDYVAGAVTRLYGLPDSEAQTLVLKYLDEEGDSCTLAPSTLEDAMKLHCQARLLKVTAVRAQPQQKEVGAASVMEERSEAPMQTDEHNSAATEAGSPPTVDGLPTLVQVLQALLGGARVKGTEGLTAEALATLLQSMLPKLLQDAPTWLQDVDKWAAKNLDVVSPLVLSL
eukprot:2804927-Amphidinium_carterae.1